LPDFLTGKLQSGISQNYTAAKAFASFKSGADEPLSAGYKSAILNL
jgi:hypothetical protein